MNATTVAMGAATGGSTAAIGIIIAYVLSLFHIVVPAELGMAFLALAAPVVHWLALKMTADENKLTVKSPIITP